MPHDDTPDKVDVLLARSTAHGRDQKVREALAMTLHAPAVVE